MTLSDEQRRALALLANANGNGATQQSLAARGFGVPMVAGLVNDGLATLTREQVKAGGRNVAALAVR